MDDLTDALSSAFDKVESAEANARPEPVAEPVNVDQPDKVDRARDDTGKFAKADKEPVKKDVPRETLSLKGKEKPVAEKEPQRQEEKPAQQTAAVKDQPSQEQIQPPAHWNGREKIDWDRLPHHVKQTLSQEYKSVAELRTLAPVLEPLKERLTREFGGVDRGLGAILATWQHARTNPVDFAKQFMQQFNISPQALGGAPGPQAEAVQLQDGQAADPQYVALQQELAAVRTQLQAVAQQPLIAQQNQIHTEISSFGNAVAPDGKLAHPYFNDVRAVMSGLFQAGKAETLQQAYEMAVWADPQIRQSLIAADAEKQSQERKRIADTARNASVSVTGAPGHRGPGVALNETVDQSLSRVWDQAASGGRA